MPVCHVISASPKPPAPGAVDEKETQAGPSGVEEGAKSGAEEEQSSHCCKVKAPRWIRACMHYRFPASIDPFTSENPIPCDYKD